MEALNVVSSVFSIYLSFFLHPVLSWNVLDRTAPVECKMIRRGYCDKRVTQRVSSISTMYKSNAKDDAGPSTAEVSRHSTLKYPFRLNL